MKTWTELLTIAVALAATSFAAVGCSDDGIAPGASSSAGGTTGGGTTDDPGNTTAPLPGTTASDEGSDGPATSGLDSTGSADDTGVSDGSTGDGPGGTTTSDDGSTGSSSDDGGSTDSGSTDGGSTDSGSTDGGSTDTGGSSGMMANPFAGDYEGTWMGNCVGIGAVNGTLEYTVADDDTLDGTFTFTLDSGLLNGTVDAMGDVNATATGMAVPGLFCDFIGQTDMAFDVTGTWDCPGAPVACSGTWVAAVI